MTRIKKLLALCLALCLFFSLAACKDANVETEPAGTEPAKTEPAATQPAETQPTDETDDVLADIAAQVELVPGTVTEKLVYIDETLTADDPRLNTTFATCGEVSVTNREFQIFYWIEYLTTLQEAGDYLPMLGFDSSVAPAEQLCTLQETTMTWEHFFIKAGLEQFAEQAAMVSKAHAEGFTLSDLDPQLLTAMDTVQAQAQNYGFSSVNALLQASFGPGVTKADYQKYLQDYYTMAGYKQKLADEMEFTDEELNEYYEENKDSLFASIGTDKPDIDVRHILIKTEDADGDGVPSDEEWAAAEQKAKDILAEYEQDPTEEHFAELANTYSDDSGSNTNGGLYSGVYPGQMVESFNDWCFADGRKSGDVEIVKADYHYQGYHIVYYVNQLDTYYWKAYAKSQLAENDMYFLVDEVREEYPLEVNYTDFVYGPPYDAEAAG